jgi:hypothetical protein
LIETSIQNQKKTISQKTLHYYENYHYQKTFYHKTIYIQKIIKKTFEKKYLHTFEKHKKLNQLKKYNYLYLKNIKN